VLGVAGNPLGLEPAAGVHDAVLRLLPQVRILDGLVNRRAENEQHKAAMEERRRRMRASSQAMIERKRLAELRRAAEEGGFEWNPEVPQPKSLGATRSARPSSAPPSLAPAPSALVPSAAAGPTGLQLDELGHTFESRAPRQYTHACTANVPAAREAWATQPQPYAIPASHQHDSNTAPAPSAAAHSSAALTRENRPGSPQEIEACSFIQSPYRTKVEFDRWRRSRLHLEPL
jgi:hypothetical protein